MSHINYWQVSQQVSQELSLYGLKLKGTSGLQLIFRWGYGPSRVGGSGTVQTKRSSLLKKVSWIKLRIRNQGNLDLLCDCHFPTPLYAVCKIKPLFIPCEASCNPTGMCCMSGESLYWRVLFETVIAAQSGWKWPPFCSWGCVYLSACWSVWQRYLWPSALGGNVWPNRKSNHVKNAVWPQVKRALPSYAGRIRGSALPTTVSQHKAYPASLSQRISNETVTKHSDHHPRSTGSRRLESTLRVIQLQHPTQDWADMHQIPQPGWGTTFEQLEHRQGTLAMSVSSSGLLFSIFTFLASLLVFWVRPLVYSAALPKVLPELEESFSFHVHCAPVLVYVLYCVLLIILGMQTEGDPLCVFSSYPLS